VKRRRSAGCLAASEQEATRNGVIVPGFLIAIAGLAGLRTLAVIAALLTLAASGMRIAVVVHRYNTPSRECLAPGLRGSGCRPAHNKSEGFT